VQRIRIDLQSERAWSRGPCVVGLGTRDLASVVVLSDIQVTRPRVFGLGQAVSARLLQDYYGVSASHARRIKQQFITAGFIAG